MSETLVLEFDGGDAGHYQRTNEILGVDFNTGDGDWPPGLISHVGSTGGGKLMVVEVWESQADAQAFFESRLGSALQQAGVPAPSRQEWRHTEGTYHF